MERAMDVSLVTPAAMVPAPVAGVAPPLLSWAIVS